MHAKLAEEADQTFNHMFWTVSNVLQVEAAMQAMKYEILQIPAPLTDSQKSLSEGTYIILLCQLHDEYDIVLLRPFSTSFLTTS